MSDINRKLWGAAELLRGEVDSGDYKIVLFCLLFYKRLCDTFRQAHKNKVKLDFTIPAGCFWANDPRPNADTVSNATADLGNRLKVAFLQIEESNPQFSDLLGFLDLQLTMDLNDRTIRQLMTHFEEIDLSTSNIDMHMLGDAYEYLLKQFAAQTGKGEFYTPKSVVQLMVRILNPTKKMSIYDPTCGAGGMLLEALRHVRTQDNNHSVQLYGQEKNKITWRIAKINMALQQVPNHAIHLGDTLRNPGHLSAKQGLKRFDIVLANPPFSQKKWGHDVWKKGDLFQRDKYATPPKSYGDLAYVLHMIRSLKPKGKLAVVVPNGVLFRMGTELQIRKGLLKDDLIAAIVELGPNLFYGASIPASILFIQSNKPHKDQILMVNASKLFKAGPSQNELTLEHIDIISKTVQNHTVHPLLSKCVNGQEIEEMGFNLSPSRYISTETPKAMRPVKDIVSELCALNDAIQKIETELYELIKHDV